MVGLNRFLGSSMGMPTAPPARASQPGGSLASMFRSRIGQGQQAPASGIGSSDSPGNPFMMTGRIQNLFGGFNNLLAGGSQSQLSQFLRQSTRQQIALTRELGPKLARLQRQIIKSDPALRLQQKNALKAQRQTTGLLKQLQQTISNPDQLDPASRRLIKENVRSRFAGMGTSTSGGAGIGEVTALMGGSAQAQQTRIQNILGALGGTTRVGAGSITTSPGPGQFNPMSLVNPSGSLTNAIPSSIAALSARNLQNDQQRFSSQSNFGQSLGQILGMGAGFMVGGPAGMQAGGQMGGQLGGSLS